jgi:hypothetical protein
MALGSKISKAKIYDKPNMNRGAATLIHSVETEDRGYEVDVTTIDSLIRKWTIASSYLKKLMCSNYKY